jgi:hypothetical protein
MNIQHVFPSEILPANTEDVLEVLRLLRENDDKSRWAAGDVCVACMGQVEQGQRMDYLRSLAAGSGFAYAGLRERWDTASFFPPEIRIWNHTVCWSHYSRARRGHDFETACNILERSEMRAWSVAQLDRFLARYRRLTGRAERIDVESEIGKAHRALTRALRGQMSVNTRRHLKAALAEVERATKE